MLRNIMQTSFLSQCISFLCISATVDNFKWPYFWPFTAAIFDARNFGLGKQNCGGSLISERIIVTGAHCLYDPHFIKNVEAYNEGRPTNSRCLYEGKGTGVASPDSRMNQMKYIESGGKNLVIGYPDLAVVFNKSSNAANTRTIFRAKSYIIHPGFSPCNSYENDLALIYLDHDAVDVKHLDVKARDKLWNAFRSGKYAPHMVDDFKEYAIVSTANVCTWNDSSCNLKPGFPSETYAVAGWGRDALIGSNHNRLQYIHVDIDKSCSDLKNFICINKFIRDGNACSGDSGGPLVMRKNNEDSYPALDFIAEASAAFQRTNHKYKENICLFNE